MGCRFMMDIAGESYTGATLPPASVPFGISNARKYRNTPLPAVWQNCCKRKEAIYLEWSLTREYQLNLQDSKVFRNSAVELNPPVCLLLLVFRGNWSAVNGNGRSPSRVFLLPQKRSGASLKDFN